MTERKAATVTIDWSTMFYACIDVRCACGKDSHVDVWNQMKKSPEHIRCPHCQAVYRCGKVVALVSEVDFNKKRPAPNAHVQWKGTELHGTAHCGCGQDDAINRDFAYDHQCTACGVTCKVEPYIELHPLSAEQVAALPADSIITPDGEEDFMDDLVDNTLVRPSRLATQVNLMPGNHDNEPVPAGVIVMPDVHAAMGREELERIIESVTLALKDKPVIIPAGDLLCEDRWFERSGSMSAERDVPTMPALPLFPGDAFRNLAAGGTDLKPDVLADLVARLGEERPHAPMLFIITDGEPK